MEMVRKCIGGAIDLFRGSKGLPTFFRDGIIPFRARLIRDRHLWTSIFVGSALWFVLISFSDDGLTVQKAYDFMAGYFTISITSAVAATAIVLSVVTGEMISVMSRPTVAKVANRGQFSKFRSLAFVMLWSLYSNLSAFLLVAFSSAFVDTSVSLVDINLWSFSTLLGLVVASVFTYACVELYAIVDILFQVVSVREGLKRRAESNAGIDGVGEGIEVCGENS